MVAPNINDGAVLHGYQVFKFHAGSSNEISTAGSVAWTTIRNYSYTSGAAIDAIICFYN